MSTKWSTDNFDLYHFLVPIPTPGQDRPWGLERGGGTGQEPGMSKVSQDEVMGTCCPTENTWLLWQVFLNARSTGPLLIVWKSDSSIKVLKPLRLLSGHYLNTKIPSSAPQIMQRPQERAFEGLLQMQLCSVRNLWSYSSGSQPHPLLGLLRKSNPKLTRPWCMCMVRVLIAFCSA